MNALAHDCTTLQQSTDRQQTTCNRALRPTRAERDTALRVVHCTLHGTRGRCIDGEMHGLQRLV
jgi:hypothetical protein